MNSLRFQMLLKMVLDVIFNLKALFLNYDSESAVNTLSFSGKGVVTAADIKTTSNVEILLLKISTLLNLLSSQVKSYLLKFLMV